ncbi:hypothetical protein N431DRAFT_545629 [Stipitochalara longipes BDJ]|nr:hypothetical protein N431DRAFT_545629 [Stipitochalara longipes BDJ]
MTSTLESLAISPYTLYTTSITSFIISRVIIYNVKKYGPLPFAPTVIKYNSYAYSIFSLCLCMGITASIWDEMSITSDPSIRGLICSSTSSKFDRKLRYIFHVSKLYEYVDIFNVLAAGGLVNAHFAIHHFTTMYLTYARVLRYSAGWKIFAVLNTMHHAIMYAYFGGSAVFSDILPWTGMLQLVAGILGEIYLVKFVWSGEEQCGSIDSLWANGLALGLLSTYLVLFTGDLRARGEKEKSE